jgi:DNA-binding transcriptional LysR family regulator
MAINLVEARGFRAAGERLGVSGSAVSQALRRREPCPRCLSDPRLR